MFNSLPLLKVVAPRRRRPGEGRDPSCNRTSASRDHLDPGPRYARLGWRIL